MNSKKLIITTGDISDADGFLALAEYAKYTDADILFIMNYPAYLRFDYNIENTEQDYFLGFNYGLRVFLYKMLKIEGNYDTYMSLLFNNYLDDTTTIKQAFIYILTKITAYLCLKVFKETKASLVSDSSFKSGNLYFMIGGINKINPFNVDIIKNEFLVYKDLILNKSAIHDEIISIMPEFKLENINQISSKEIQSQDIKISTNKYIYCLTIPLSEFKPDFSEYNEVYVDGNGSISFYGNKAENKLFFELLQSSYEKIKGFYIMGGVLADIPAYTLSILHKRLHRAAVATMNQLYSPEYFYNLIDYFNEKKIPLIFVPNHSVLASSDIINEMDYLLSGSEILKEICNCYYRIANGAKKPFDVVVAKLLIRHMNTKLRKKELDSNNLATLIYNKKYGATILTSHIDTENRRVITGKKKEELQKNILNFKVLQADLYINDNEDIQKESQTEPSNLIDEYKSEDLTTLSLFNCYIGTINDCTYTGDKPGNYMYSENTKPIIAQYTTIIGKYTPSTGGYKNKKNRKIRRLKIYKK